MTLDILEKTEQVLLARTDILAEKSFEGAVPSRKDIKAELTSKLNLKGELVVIKRIDTAYGFKKAKIFASIYKDEKALGMLSKKYLLKRGLPKEKKEEESKEAPKEAPKEGKKEEPKQEAKETPKEEKKEEPKEAKEEKKESKEESKNPDKKEAPKESKEEQKTE